MSIGRNRRLRLTSFAKTGVIRSQCRASGSLTEIIFQVRCTEALDAEEIFPRFPSLAVQWAGAQVVLQV